MLKQKANILMLSDLIKIKDQDNGEPIVDLSIYCPEIYCQPYRKDYPPYLRKILIRETLASKLKTIQQKLTLEFPSLRLAVVDGYRNLAFQKKYFLQQMMVLKKKNPELTEQELKELTHTYIASPDVAGHPTGGAIDITILEHGVPMDMGSEIADFTDSTKMSTYSDFITPLQQRNRIFLHDLMIQEMFAPFYGEWWHFSYGDKEWAAFYNKEVAIYHPLSLEHINVQES